MEAENHLKSFAEKGGLAALPREELRQAKRLGFSDDYIGRFLGATEDEVRARRMADGIIPTYKAVDTCAAEFEAYTPYFYSTYEEENEALPVPDKESVIILGSGPNRIGQGIEFDYCCVHAVQEMRELGYQAIMVNCNPETVSTDYDTSDRLYFEPLTFEDVLNIIENEKPKGVVVQFGGQTPLKIAERLHAAGVPILGTSQDAIDLAEDRERFGEVLQAAEAQGAAVRHRPQRAGGARRGRAHRLPGPGAPVVRAGRPGHGDRLRPGEPRSATCSTAVKASPRHPVLIDRFLEHSTEIDVDALCDGEDVYIGAVMQHVEEAGIHSGDSACVIPTVSLGDDGGAAHRGADGRPGQELGRGRPHERAVRGAAERPRRGQHLRAGGQPAGQPHGALRQQGHRRLAGPHGHPGHRRAEAARPGPARLGGVGRRRPGALPARPAARRRQGGRAALPALPRRGHHPGPGDEVHRRGHGRGHQLPRGLRQGLAGRR